MYYTEVTETTTVDDHDGISKHRLMPISPTFYNITLIIDDDWIPAPNELLLYGTVEHGQDRCFMTTIQQNKVHATHPEDNVESEN